jgi:hypothetical protein
MRRVVDFAEVRADLSAEVEAMLMVQARRLIAPRKQRSRLLISVCVVLMMTTCFFSLHGEVAEAAEPVLSTRSEALAHVSASERHVDVAAMEAGAWPSLLAFPSLQAPSVTAVCSPRPPVRAQLTEVGDGRLRAVVSAQQSSGISNTIQALDFGTFRNAVVDVQGWPLSAYGGFRFVPTTGSSQVSFILSRPTSSGGVSASLTVQDECGDWKTFVGAGSSFPWASPPPSVIVAPPAIVSFQFPASVTQSDRQLITDGVSLGGNYYANSLGFPIQGATSIIADVTTTTGFVAAASGHTITVRTANPNWGLQSQRERLKILAHEYFHVLQGELSNQSHSTTATWLMEGSADLFAHEAVIRSGYIDYKQMFDCQLLRLKSNPGAPLLSSLETSAQWNTAISGPLPVYSQAHLAAEYLARYQGQSAVIRHFQHLPTSDWRATFLADFGISASTFYQQFYAYLASLPTPSGNPCPY